jgi:hypothetical protein
VAFGGQDFIFGRHVAQCDLPADSLQVCQPCRLAPCWRAAKGTRLKTWPCRPALSELAVGAILSSRPATRG